jgi:hypothetical protein
LPSNFYNRSHQFGFVKATIVLVACISCGATLAQSRNAASGRTVAPPNDRFHVEIERDIRVTTAVPTKMETLQIFGFGLYAKNIQPVWIQIENLSDESLWFLQSGVDEGYFTPIETSYRQQNQIPILDWALNRDYYALGMRMEIGPGDLRSGYIFTRVDQGTKSFNVDVASKEKLYRLSFFVPVPGLRVDHHRIVWEELYAEDEFKDVDLESLTAEIEALPCCVTDKKEKNYGDPLNLAIVGEGQDVFYAFLRAGWDETEVIYSRSIWKTMRSSISGGEYRYSPVSALYVYGRPQDVALQKARASIHQRNHLRLWATPLRFDGKPVWIGQISRDIGVRPTIKTITTHKIDPDVDETREFLLEDLVYAQSVSGVGYVGGVGAATFDEPRGNLTGDPYFTDGLRIVMFLSADPVAIDEIDLIDMGQHPLRVGK